MSRTGQRKEEIITFKVDEELAEALGRIRNRSDFIRQAVLAAIGNICPVCNGSGTMTVSQKRHWEEFTRHHHVAFCEDCHEPRMVCDHEMVTR